jgi:hypothetical protein
MSEIVPGPTRFRDPAGAAARQADADAFFTRRYSPEEIDRLLATLPDRWVDVEQENARAKAAFVQQQRQEAARAKNEKRERQREQRAAARAKQEQDAARKQAKREYQRQWYAANREHYLAYQKAYRQAAREADPERYLELQRGRMRRWYDSHRQERNEIARDAYREHPDPVARSSQRRQYYAEHAEELAARKREDRAADPEHAREVHRRWSAREKLRHDAGLPVKRIRHTPRAERDANDAAAAAFFSQPVTPDGLEKLMAEKPTRKELLAAMAREMSRARADDAFGTVLPVLLRRREVESARRIAAAIRAQERQDLAVAAEKAEEARMDAIARAINDQLRSRADPRRSHHNDPAAPHQSPGISPGRGGPHR